MAINYPSCEWNFSSIYLEELSKFNITKETLEESLGPCAYLAFDDLSDAFVYSLIALYCFVIPTGVIGNLCVIWLIISSPTLHKPVNFLLLSLSFSDLIISILMAWTLTFNISYDYNLGEGLCRTVPTIQGTAVMSSIYALLFIAIERHQVTLYPTASRYFHSPLKLSLLIALLWIGSFCFQIPQLVVLREHVLTETIVVKPGRISYTVVVHYCAESWSPKQSENYTIAIIVFMYATPLLLLIILYSRIGYFLVYRRPFGNRVAASSSQRSRVRRKRLLTLFVLLVTIFGICWGPYFVVMLFCYRKECNPELVPYLQWFGHLNVALDPILYAVLHLRIREEFISRLKNLRRKITRCCCKRGLTRSNAVRRASMASPVIFNDRNVSTLNALPVFSVTSPTDRRENATSYDSATEINTQLTAVVSPYSAKHVTCNTMSTHLPGMVEIAKTSTFTNDKDDENSITGAKEDI